MPVKGQTAMELLLVAIIVVVVAISSFIIFSQQAAKTTIETTIRAQADQYLAAAAFDKPQCADAVLDRIQSPAAGSSAYLISVKPSGCTSVVFTPAVLSAIVAEVDRALDCEPAGTAKGSCRGLSFDIGVNLVSNAGFESAFASWTKQPASPSPPSDDISISNVELHSGAASAHTKDSWNDCAPGHNWVAIHQVFGVEPSTRYNFSFWAKAESGRLNPWILDNGASDPCIGCGSGNYRIWAVTATTWQQYSVLYTTQSDTKKMAFILGDDCAQAGAGWFDDVSVVKQ
jgi:hypothetical protein